MAQKKTGQIGRTLAGPIDFVEENIYFSITEQCQWYEIGRNCYYYNEVIRNRNKDIKFIDLINSQYGLDITQGSRRIAAELSKKGNEVSRSVIMRLMREIGIQGVVPKKNLSMPKTGD